MGIVTTRHYYEEERTIAPRNTDRSEDNTTPEDAIASNDELKDVLHVKKIDLNIAANTRNHHTDDYDCTEEREDVGFGSKPKLVVRRGQPFTIVVNFDRPFSLEKDDLKIILSTGPNSELYSCTQGKFDVDESGNTKFKPFEWGSNLLKKEGNTATIEIHIPADCAIGHWNLEVATKSKVQGGNPTTFQIKSPIEIIVLFNPWCPDDIVYMKKESDLKEYILNDNGCVFRGQSFRPRGKVWNFGQFEEGILEISLDLIYKLCRKGENRHRLGDPIRVSRDVAQVVNCNDADNGVLHGRWDGEYKDGKTPGHWSGSVEILEEYHKYKKPVKYGQCWVFSGLTTTVCRALGIPALSVTNYSSAHDTNDNNVIEKHYKKDEDGNYKKVPGGDSVWNYHVWNQVWMRRPDIDSSGKYDGWQAIDATPQELSDGVFTCGPSPLAAIKNGDVSVSYDTGFVFSEVNADVIHLDTTNEDRKHWKMIRILTDDVGKSISTKEPNGKKYVRSPWSSDREDLTNDYKYREGTTEARNAVMKAAMGAERVSDLYTKPEKQDVVFKLLHDENLILGKHVDVKLTAENKSEYRRTLVNVKFHFRSERYDGELIKEIKTDKQDVREELVPGKVYEYTTRLEVKDYFDCIDDNRLMCIWGLATVEKTRSRPIQLCMKEHTVVFDEPDIDVKMPESARKGEEFEAEITFENPLDEKLTGCIAGYEGRGFTNVSGVKMDNVTANGKASIKFNMKAKRAGRFNVTFKFTSDQIYHLSGVGEITIV